MRSAMLILFVLVSYSLLAQEYQVIHVKGDIIREESGESLKAGDKVSDDERIQFKTKDAMAAVLNPELGRFILKSEADKETRADLFYVIKSTVTPVRGGMSTRAAGINNAFDMQVYFAEATYVWVGEYIALRVSSVTFPQDENNFFFLRYEYNGNQINRRLDHKEHTLLMKKKDVFDVEGKMIAPSDASNFELHYYRDENEESMLITEIDFAFVSRDELMTIYNSFKDASKYPFNDVADLLSNMYGKCDPVQVQYNIMNQ